MFDEDPLILHSLITVSSKLPCLWNAPFMLIQSSFILNVTKCCKNVFWDKSGINL